MKRILIRLIVCCAAGLIAGGAAAKGRQGVGEPPMTAPSDVYAKYDANNNGVLNADERDAIRKDFEADKNGPLKKYDTDNDGKLSDAEIFAIPAIKLVDEQADKPARTKKHKKK